MFFINQQGEDGDLTKNLFIEEARIWDLRKA